MRPPSFTRSPSRKVFSAAMAASERPGGGASRDRVENRSASMLAALPVIASFQSLNA